MYEVRFDEKESGYVTIAKNLTLEQAKEELKNQIKIAKIEDDTTTRIQIIDENENVVEEHIGSNY